MWLAWPKVTCQLSVNISKDFSYETSGPISFKFYMQSPSKGDRMTKMAAMPIDG